MCQSLLSHFIDLVRDALLKSFWRKPTFRQFLWRHRVKDSFLVTITSEETTRETLNRLFPKLEKTDEGRLAIKQMSSQAGKTIRNAGSRSESQWVLLDEKNNGKQTK
jgi:hypothetical protein